MIILQNNFKFLRLLELPVLDSFCTMINNNFFFKVLKEAEKEKEKAANCGSA